MGCTRTVWNGDLLVKSPNISPLPPYHGCRPPDGRRCDNSKNLKLVGMSYSALLSPGEQSLSLSSHSIQRTPMGLIYMLVLMKTYILKYKQSAMKAQQHINYLAVSQPQLHEKIGCINRVSIRQQFDHDFISIRNYSFYTNQDAQTHTHGVSTAVLLVSVFDPCGHIFFS